MKKFLFLALLALVVFSCSSPKVETPGTATDQIDGHPAWIMQGNVYEVNVRQYTPEGTLNAFAKHLDRIKEMGVQTVWFMPLNPISKKDRKGTLGSYYAVSDYNALNPEFGTMEDFKQVVKSIHEKGMKVLIDWVPNHTGADHRWLTEHPDFYVKDKKGNPAFMMDWTDTRVLDFNNLVMQDSMIAAMKHWLVNCNLDGFRVDVAWNVPASFWNKCIPALKAAKPNIFMLAEGDKGYLARCGFDAIYPWHMFSVMVKIAKGEKTAEAIDSVKMSTDTVFTSSTIHLFFTSNHDENSWNKADYGTFPGAVHAPFAVFSQTMVQSVPLIYSGQEEPLLRPLPFFEKDSISFKKLERAEFYKTLLELRKNNPALAANASFMRLNAGDRKAVYSYVREQFGNKVLVVLNLSGQTQNITINDESLLTEAKNVFKKKKETVGKEWTLEPWGYAVYEYVK
jgi:alpha-amylase